MAKLLNSNKRRIRMILTYRDGCFVASASYDERHLPKEAGFWWHPSHVSCYSRQKGYRCLACEAGLEKSWWTPDPSKAVRLASVADDKAKEALRIVSGKLESSRSASSNIDILCNVGMSYMPFQRAGIEYIINNTDRGTLLADEMGLGKTIQVLGAINVKQYNNILVICPATLRLNWKFEAEKWLVNSYQYHVVSKNLSIPKESNFVIVNFEMLKGKVLASIMSRQWDLLVIDEAHYLKNPKAKRTKSVFGTPKTKTQPQKPGIVNQCQKLLFLTGTPLLNRPIELQTILSALDPDNPKWQWWKFVHRYCNAHYEYIAGRKFLVTSGSSNKEELQTELRTSLMVRRLKSQVLKELPAKRRQVVVIPANGMSHLINQQNKLVDKDAINPDNYDKSIAKLQYGDKIDFEEISRLRREIAIAKAPYVVSHVANMLESGCEKIVIMAHHHKVVDQLLEGLKDYNPVSLTGREGNEIKQRNVYKFQEDPNCKVFIGSIKAAGVGITLTASSHVVFAELDWVPGNVTQAEDRCHRIGQSDTVLIQHLVVDDSLEAHLAKIIVDKQSVFDAIMDKDTSITANFGQPKSQTSVKTSTQTKAKVGNTISQSEYNYQTDTVPAHLFEHNKIKINVPDINPYQRVILRKALQELSDHCDGASTRDAQGFNGAHKDMGPSLAYQTYAWTLRQLDWVYYLVNFYKGQIPTIWEQFQQKNSN